VGSYRQRARRAADARAVPVEALNAYQCATCGGHTVTVDVDPGTTPANLGCRAQGVSEDGRRNCPGMAASLGYPDPWPTGVPDVPRWEWYRAQGEALQQLRQAGGAMWQHHRKGGLMLRPRRLSPS
jgi:hypothetical protein